MGNNVRKFPSQSDRNIALSEARAAQHKANAPTGQSFTVDGEQPPRVPVLGESVEFTFADMQLIDSPRVQLGFIVAGVIPSPDGRIDGWLIMSPRMQMADPHGRPMGTPMGLPIQNAAYCRERKPLTWRFHGDFVEEAAPAAVEQVDQGIAPPVAVEQAAPAAVEQAALVGGANGRKVLKSLLVLEES